MSRVEVRLLGPPRVIPAEPMPPIRRRRALALAAYLAAGRVPHTREALATTFWPDADRDNAHAQLRNHLWVLRTSGLDAWLTIEGEMIELRAGAGLWVDVREHRRMLAEAGLAAGRGGPLAPRAERLLAEATALYQDRFLAGFSLADSFAFEEWQLREEESLRADQGAALEALIRLREQRGDAEGALDAARRHQALDPLNEQALRTLMSLYLRQGRGGEALQAYERYSALLERDLEIRPARETVLLRNEILARGAVGTRPRTAAAPRLTLPDPPAPFVGRELELAEIARFLGEPDLRVLTLTGPGGCGKTRLALEAGRRLGAMFADGAAFVPLAAAEVGRQLPGALSEALSLPQGTQDRLPTRAEPLGSGSHPELIDFLREKRMLLVLDNLEQIAGDLGALREILAAARGIVILATSRSRLRLPGEQVVEVTGLPWPARKASLEDASRCPSVRLFVQTVRRMRSPFTPSRAELLAAGEIARRLRGHPLGIELAASWAHCLAVTEIAAQLAAGLDLEAAPRADVPDRHRSLRLVFEQSWRLLSPTERPVFRRLCCLPGSFDRGAALAVGDAAPAEFSALVEQSLVRRAPDGRFEILETLRQFGREALARNAREESSARDRAARHYLGRLTAARGALEGAGQKQALRHLAHDRHNLRQAWLRAAERGWVAEMSPAMRPLFLFYDMSSRVVEGAEVLERTVRFLAPRAAGHARTGGTGPLQGRAARERGSRARAERGSRPRARLAALACVAQAWFMRYQHPARSRMLLRRGQRALHALAAPLERAFADTIAAALTSSSARVEPALREAARQAERSGDLWCAGLACELLAYHLSPIRPDEALRWLHRSLALRRRSRDRWSIALGLYVLGLALEHRGLLRGARRRFEESMTLRRRLGVDPDGILDCLEGIVRIALHTGALADASRHCADALALARRLGHRVKIGVAQTRLAQIHLLTGAPLEVGPLLEPTLGTAEAVGGAPWVSHVHVLAGLAALDLGDEDEARWSLERALLAVQDDADGARAPSTAGIVPRVVPGAWQGLLAARLALLRGEPAEAEERLTEALRAALDARHEPLLAEILATRAETCAQAGRAAAAARLASALLACPGLDERHRNRLAALKRSRAADAPPDAPPNMPAALSPGAFSHTPAALSPEVTLLRLAAGLLAAPPSRDAGAR